MTSAQLSVEATTRSDELLERSRQLNALDQHLTAVMGSGHGRLILVSGEAGLVDPPERT